ncbi:MAG: hypothetical protein LAP61_19595 [Acidobacteriia bacterium]|nr:hypothetical protein [Terriglobia bacterium]
MVISQKTRQGSFRHVPLAIVAISLAALGSVSAQNQTVQSYPLSGQVRYLDGQWEGIKYASDGNVYFGSSSQSAHHGASFFKYSPATQQVTMLAEDITTICGEDPQTNPQGKIHSDIQEMHGWLFFTTHFAADDRPGGIAGWTGAHLIGYRLTDNGSNNYFGTPVGGFHDYGVMYPGYDAYSGIAVDPAQNYIYAFATGILGGQVSYVFRYNAATDTQATRVNLGQVYGTFGASLYWFVDATGDVWFTLYNDNGALHRIHHDTQVIDRYDNALPAFIRQDSNTPDVAQDRAVQWMAPISATKAVFTYNQGGMLYQFDSSQATANSVPASAFTSLKWIGPSYIGAALGNNRVFWYQRAGGAIGHQGCDAADTTLPPTCQDYHLMSVSLDSSTGYAITDHGLIVDQLGRTVWRTPSMATDGTNENVFLVGDWWTYDTSGYPIPGDHGVNNTLRYHYSGGVESYLDEPRGEFFAVAHTSETPGSVSVAPPMVTLGQSQTQQFTATIHNQADQTVNWSLSPVVGTVSSGGLYQAPAVISSGQTLLVKATNASDASLFASASVTLQPPSGGAAVAQFVRADTTTQGNWKSAYGNDGFNVLGDVATYSVYTSVTPSGNSFYVWNPSTTDPRALQKSVATDRVAATWYSPGTLTLDLNLTSGLPRQVAIYAVDWDSAGRTESVTVRDAVSGVMLDGRTLSGFTNGTYLVWAITGHVTITISCTAGSNAVISGIFFGTAFGPGSVGPTPPVITQSPQSTTVTAGQTANFSVTAVGTGPMSYQWQSQPAGGSTFSNISAATQSTYTIAATQVADSGTEFRVVVTNIGGSVTTSAATLTVQAAGGGGGATAFVTSKVLNGPRNSYDGWVGMAIHVGASPLAVSVLGRIVAPGNSHTHTVKIVDGATGIDVPGGSALVVTAGATTGAFVYANLANPITLNAGSTYYVLSLENSGFDAWYDYNSTTIHTTADATASSAVYSSGASYSVIGTPGQTYGPVDFQYTVGVAPPPPPPPAPVVTQDPISATVTAGQTAIFSVNATGTGLSYQWQSQAPGGSSFANIAGATQASYTTPTTQVADSGTQFRCVVTNGGGSVNSGAATLTVQPVAGGGSPGYVTSKTLNGPRNDYSGWVGMAIHVGANPLAVSAVGRIVAPGNSHTHTVKIVDGATGSDVPGGSALVVTPGGTSGSFAYTTLAYPITLNAGSTYYVLSQESSGADAWYDYSNTTIHTTADATATSAVYGSGASYSVIGAPGQTYGPVDFQYTVGAAPPPPPPPAPVVTQDPVSATVTAGQTATFSVTATGTGLSYQWQSQAAGGSSFANIAGATQASYTTPTTQVANSGTQFRCVVTNGGGSVNSGAATLTVQPVVGGGSPGFVTSKTVNGPRNDYSGWVGMAIHVGANPLAVSAVGRIVAPGNSHTHTVKIVDGATGADVPGGSAAVVTAGGTSGSFAYTTLAYPITLNAGSVYYVLSQENAGVDAWYDFSNTTIHTTSDATATSAAYSSGATYAVVGTPGQTYGPVDFEYTVGVAPPPPPPPAPVVTQDPVSSTVTAGQTATFSVTATGTGLSYQWQSQAPGGSSFANIAGATSGSYTTPATQVAGSGTQFRCVVTNGGGSVNSGAATLTVQPPVPSGPTPFVTSKVFGTPRNDFNGWIGMAVHVGSSPLIVNALGRIKTTGSTGSHLMKIVDGATGVDLPGASVSVATAGGTVGSFVYANLASPIGLSAGSTYYILSQETSGGDKWDDYNNTVVQTTSDATAKSAVYSSGASYFVIGSTGQTYGPVDFQYTVSSGSLPPAAPLITQNPQSATVLAGQTATFTVAAASSTTLSYQWQSQPSGGSFANIPGATSSTYTTPAAQASNNGTLFRAVVTNAGGSVNSSAATLNVLSGTTPFITSSTPGAARNDFEGWVGMIMTVGANPLVVSSMGRVCAPGNSGTHIVKFVDANTETDIVGASVSVNMAGCTVGQFVYSTLPNLITLQPGTTYYLASNEGYGGDNYYDWGPVTYTNDGTVNDSIYSPNSSYWKPIHKASHSYGPPNFQYSIGSPTTPPPDPGAPFVTAYNLNSKPVRHDFTGWVGMKLTIGDYPVTVSELGRAFVPGNSGTHTIKFVLASDGSDVPGGSASVIMAGGTAGQFNYTALANPITLQPNTAYYLVSQELIGGDFWYDYNLLSTTTAGIVNSAVYWDGASWIPVGAGTVSYVPPNFK